MLSFSHSQCQCACIFVVVVVIIFPSNVFSSFVYFSFFFLFEVFYHTVSIEKSVRCEWGRSDKQHLIDVYYLYFQWTGRSNTITFTDTNDVSAHYFGRRTVHLIFSSSSLSRLFTVRVRVCNFVTPIYRWHNSCISPIR